MGGKENATWEEEVYYTPRSQGRDRGMSQREDTSIHQEAEEPGAAEGLSKARQGGINCVELARSNDRRRLWDTWWVTRCPMSGPRDTLERESIGLVCVRKIRVELEV